ncbi:DNA internalization-related competence protein ComEC/Rec2 [Acinetobacter sp. WCHAc060033]|nr:DNA internalization-related competence protein ComEC/Rec2 [Acinetobacter sp. WCHAc060033]
MYIYVLLFGWIFGISFMGHQIPQNLSVYICLNVSLVSALILGKYLKFKYAHVFAYKMLYAIALGLSSYLLGMYYADSALEKRLSLREVAQKHTEQIIYISHINKIKDKTSESNQVNSQRFGQKKSKNQQSIQNSIQQRVTVLTAQQPIQVMMYVNPSQLEAIQLGQYYRVAGEIKPIHGFAVEGVFDKEKWLIQENISGQLKAQSFEVLDENQVQQFGYGAFVRQQHGLLNKIQLEIESLRLDFRTMILNSSLQNKGLLLALLTGDESLLSNQTQDFFKKLGISHLLAISGPHVLIFAVIFCFIFNKIIQSIYPRLFLKIPRPYLLVFPFWACVIFYTAFVGFEIPAVRTLITVSILSVIILLKQKIQALKHLLLTASVLLLIDPFSILSAAFWLSFGACFILIRVYQTIQQQSNEAVQTWQVKSKLFLRVLFDSQWKTFLALLPLVLFIFQQFSWITPFSNLIAIPMIGTLIVPIEVFAACVSMLYEPLGILIFKMADGLLSILLFLLEKLDQLFAFQLNWWAFNTLEIVCIAFAVLILFFPRGVLPKFWAVICLVPLFLPQKNTSIFQLNIIDVGQGQAIFLKLPDHKMMIDVGGSFDESQFSIGKNVIIPYLMRQSIDQLDQVILTHLDQDHSGAFSEVEKVLKIKKVYSNEKDARFEHANFEYCHQGQHWQYDQIKITVLSPPKNLLSQAPYHQNELSCVVYIQIPQSKSYQNFLLMGDAGWETEFNLLQQYPDLKVDVLVLGHHGSHNSSSYAFLKQLKPKLAIASVGYTNRYGHPHPLVLKRLEVLKIPFKTTIEQGSIQFDLNTKGVMTESDFRSTRKWLIFNKGAIAD